MKPISASALKLFDGCPRRWAFRYIDGVEEPETEANSLGKKVHDELEQWIKHGRVPTHPVAKRLLGLFKDDPYFPGPGTTTAEEEFVMTIAGVRWKGYTDWRNGGITPGQRRVGDWKSVSDLKYALAPETVTEKRPNYVAGTGCFVDSDGKPDVQSTIYAAREFVEGAEEVWGVWAYASTKNETKRLVVVKFDRARVEELYGEMHPRAETMRDLLAIRPKSSTVPYRSSYCFAYHKPCPYRDACPKVSGMFSSDPLDLDLPEGANAMTDFLTKIRQSFPNAVLDVEDAPPPPPEDDDAPPPPPEDGPSDSDLEACLPEGDEPPPPPPEDEVHPAEALALEYAASTAAPSRDVTGEVESGFVNPPEAKGKPSYRDPAEAAAGEGVAAPVEKVKKPAKPKGKKAKVVEMDEPVATSDGSSMTLADVQADMLVFAERRADELLDRTRAADTGVPEEAAPLTAEEVRKIFREELGQMFASFAKAFEGSK